jgi:GNAT superfamily N-acetyltransferase
MEITIGEMVAADVQRLSDAFVRKPRSLFDGYLAEHREGQRTVLVARRADRSCGYLTIFWRPVPLLPGDRVLPVIRDFNVVNDLQRRGIGSRLMDRAEELVGAVSDTIGIGVGLHLYYGTAQRMYVKRGYIPDGRGVFYHDQQAEVGQAVRNDDDLILHFTKRLKP